MSQSRNSEIMGIAGSKAGRKMALQELKSTNGGRHPEEDGEGMALCLR
jgi:hypothetical protein